MKPLVSLTVELNRPRFGVLLHLLDQVFQIAPKFVAPGLVTRFQAWPPSLSPFSTR